jgi:hypothetical protein
MYDEVVGHSIIPDMVTAVIAEITKLGTQFVSLISSTVTNVLGKFTELATQAIAAVTKLATDIGATADSFLSAAQNIGSDIISGMINGIKNGIGSLMDAAKNAAQSMLDAAKNALASHSPSRKFADLGNDSVSGLILGIDEMIPQLATAAQGLASEFVKDATTRLDDLKTKYSAVLKDVLGSVVSFNSSMMQSFADMNSIIPEDKLTGLKDEAIKLQDELTKTTEDNAQKRIDIEQKIADLTVSMQEDTSQKILDLQTKLAEDRAKMASDETNPEQIAKNNKIIADDEKQIAKAQSDAVKQRAKDEKDLASLQKQLADAQSGADVTALQKQIEDNKIRQQQAQGLADQQKTIQDAAQRDLNAAQEEYLKNREKDPQGAAQIFEEKRKQIAELAKMNYEETQATYDGDIAKEQMIQNQRNILVQNHAIQLKLIQDEVQANAAKQAQAIEDIRNTAAEIESVFRGNNMDHFGTIGTQMAEGIASGIASKMQTVKDALISGTGDAIAALKAYLGIHSPSTLFADTIGAPSIDGWAKGIDQNIGTLTGATINAGQASINAAGMTSGATSGAVGSNSVIYNISLDLSGSTLTRPEVEKILDTRMDKIAQTALRVRRA